MRRIHHVISAQTRIISAFIAEIKPLFLCTPSSIATNRSRPPIGIPRLHLGRMLLLYFFDPIPSNLTYRGKGLKTASYLLKRFFKTRYFPNLSSPKMKELLLLLRLTVRVVFVGRATDPEIKLVANDKIEIHGWIQKPAVMSPVEFTFPAEASKDGALKLRWAARLGSGWIQRLHRPRRGLPEADPDSPNGYRRIGLRLRPHGALRFHLNADPTTLLPPSPSPLNPSPALIPFTPFVLL